MTWSPELIEKTREMIFECLTAPDNYLCFKQYSGARGRIHFDDLVRQHFKIVDRSSGEETLYETVDDLIKDGWAVD